jgi:hypothetical protein
VLLKNKGKDKMKNQNQSITNKMEDLFLSILRGVILFVLAGSILGAIYFAVTGVTDLGAKPEEYKYEKFDSKQLVDDLKETLDPKPAPASNAPAAPAPPAVKSPVKVEITELFNLITKYFKPYDMLTDQAFFEREVEKESKILSIVYGSGENAQIEYLKGMKLFFENVLLNVELNKLIDKNYKAEADRNKQLELVNEFSFKVRDFYSEFHREQIAQKKEFEADQRREVATRHAGSMFKLYLAGGMFAAFLLISLILVLVKIERNLRSTKIEEIHEA